MAIKQTLLLLQNDEQATQLPRTGNYAVFPVNRFGCGPALKYP